MTAPDPIVGRVLDGRYEIMARIGEGGMGVVYKARQISIDRIIAIKMLNAQMAQDQTWVQRFNNEAKACSRLQHPNTIRIFDFGQAQNGQLFMTMEFLDGVVLRSAIEKGPMAPQRVMKILIQCCASLAEAHSIGIIHRDIKPDNVFLLNMAGSPDFVKLLDFSVAKLLQEGDRLSTQAGVVFGTPQYMSPEQGRGLPLDARSDLYALGVLAYEMLVGRVPFHDENPMSVIQMHLRAEIPPMPQAVPYAVQQVVRRALEKDPARRYQSSGEMMQHCQQVFAELTQGAQGGASIGAGGAPRTAVGPGVGPGVPPQGYAPGAPPQGAPMQPMPAQPSGGYVSAAPQQKTMIAQVSPFAPGQPLAGQVPGQVAPMPGPGPMMSSPGGVPANQKTIVAGMAPPFLAAGGYPGGPGGFPPPAGPGGFPPPAGPGGFPPPAGPGGFPPPAAGGPAKTMMIQPSEGVVSMAAAGASSSAVAASPVPGAGARGASAMFWVVCLMVGVALGALGYVIVLQL